MANFQRVTTLSRWVLGSLVSETGSEYLFGYDPSQGLMWLERPGHKYSASDPVWKQAEQFISSREQGAQPPEAVPHVHEDRPRAVTRSAAPQQVQRSVDDDWEDPYPMDGDPRVVGDMSTTGRDIPDDDIAQQAEQFLLQTGSD